MERSLRSHFFRKLLRYSYSYLGFHPFISPLSRSWTLKASPSGRIGRVETRSAVVIQCGLPPAKEGPLQPNRICAPLSRQNSSPRVLSQTRIKLLSSLPSFQLRCSSCGWSNLLPSLAQISEAELAAGTVQQMHDFLAYGRGWSANKFTPCLSALSKSNSQQQASQSRRDLTPPPLMPGFAPALQMFLRSLLMSGIASHRENPSASVLEYFGQVNSSRR